ncbi:hypothetical protein [Kineococcus sp. SYSU DK001]|uniref:hypothetical protein n=1 Tax=Kineococcus sp. SYSU DK001 TaxID=3383122 RepID=UPI003D7D5B3D
MRTSWTRTPVAARPPCRPDCWTCAVVTGRPPATPLGVALIGALLARARERPGPAAGGGAGASWPFSAWRQEALG